MVSTSTAPGSGTLSPWNRGLILAGVAISVVATGKLLQYFIYSPGQTSTAGWSWGGGGGFWGANHTTYASPNRICEDRNSLTMFGRFSCEITQNSSNKDNLLAGFSVLSDT